jgi:hypothetical protein
MCSEKQASNLVHDENVTIRYNVAQNLYKSMKSDASITNEAQKQVARQGWACFRTKLQPPSPPTTLPPCAVSWDWSHILCITNNTGNGVNHKSK